MVKRGAVIDRKIIEAGIHIQGHPVPLPITSVELEPADSDPFPDMDCGEVPLNKTVPADAGPNIRVATP